MSTTVEPRVGVRVVSTRRVVEQSRRYGKTQKRRYVLQPRHGYRGAIQIPGEPKPVYCCEFHTKPGTARQHALVVGRRIAKERGLLPPEA